MPEPTTAVERYDEPRGAVALSERDMKSIAFQAKGIAYLDSRLKKMKPEEREHVSLGIAITLHGYGLPITVPNGKKLHILPNGEVFESAQLLIGLLEMGGHEVRPVEISDQKVTLRGWKFGRGEPYEMTYTIDQARRSHALDEWVEDWQNGQNGRYLAGKYVTAVDGVPTEGPVPEWAQRLIAAGKVKRNTAWFDYREDMLGNRCVRRLSKWLGGASLLGVGRADEFDDDGERLAAPLHRVEDHDDDITDAELVDEPASGSSTVPDGGETGSAPATASQQWVSDFLAACQDAGPEGVRPGALAAAIVRHVTDGERSEPSTLRRGAEQTAAKAAFAEVVDGRWDIGTGHDGMAVLVEAAPKGEE